MKITHLTYPHCLVTEASRDTQNHCFLRGLRQSRVPEQKDQPVKPHGPRNQSIRAQSCTLKPLIQPLLLANRSRGHDLPEWQGLSALAGTLAVLRLDTRPPRWDLPQPSSEGVIPTGMQDPEGQGMGGAADAGLLEEGMTSSLHGQTGLRPHQLGPPGRVLSSLVTLVSLAACCLHVIPAARGSPLRCRMAVRSR